MPVFERVTVLLSLESLISSKLANFLASFTFNVGGLPSLALAATTPILPSDNSASFAVFPLMFN